MPVVDRDPGTNAAGLPVQAQSQPPRPLSNYYDPYTGRQFYQDELWKTDEYGRTIPAQDIVRSEINGTPVLLRGAVNAQGVMDYVMDNNLTDQVYGKGTAQAYSTTQASQQEQEAAAAGIEGQREANARELQAQQEASAQALQAQQEAGASARAEADRAAQAQRDEAQRAWQAEQNRLAAEAAERHARLDTLTRLVSDFATRQDDARKLIFQLGPDPFKQAAAMQGMAVRGVTPQQAYAKNLGDYASQPVPTITPDASLDQLNSAISGITGGNNATIPGLPQQPVQGFLGGMAYGGGAPFGPGMKTALVGERGPEIMQMNKKGVRVIPLNAAGEQGFDWSSTDAAFAPLWQGLGYTPRYGGSHIGGAGGEYSPWMSDPGQLANLGYRPTVIREYNQNQTGLEGGAHNLVWGGDRYYNVGEQDIGKFNLGSEIGLPRHYEEYNNMATPRGDFTGDMTPFSRPSNLNPNGVSAPFGMMGQPLFTPNGYVLPAPYRVANVLSTLKAQGSPLYDLILSAYGNATDAQGNVSGLSKQAVEAQIGAAGPGQGVAQNQSRLIGFR